MTPHTSVRRRLAALTIACAVAAACIVSFLLALDRSGVSTPTERESAVVTAGTKRVLRLGKIPIVSPREAYRIYSVFLDLVEEHLDCCELELVLARDYTSCVQMLANGEIDLAWLGTAAYVENRHAVEMRPLVRPIWAGRASYRGVIFTLDGTEITSLAQLKGRKVAFVDRQSASGYVYPAALLARAGIDVERDLAQTAFLGSHDAVLLGVLLGEYDAGAVFERAYTTVADHATRVRLRVLAQTEPIPGEPIVAGASLDSPTADAVKAAFLAIAPEKFAQTELTDFFAFEPASDADYDKVRAIR